MDDVEKESNSTLEKEPNSSGYRVSRHALHRPHDDGCIAHDPPGAEAEKTGPARGVVKLA